MNAEFPVEQIDPRRMRPHPKNWAEHPLKQRVAIAGSLEEFGWLEPIVWNRRSGFILNGHARVLEAIDQEAATVPVRVVDVDDATELRILATLNRTGDLREENAQALAALLSELAETEDGLSPGWEEDDLQQTLDALRVEVSERVPAGDEMIPQGEDVIPEEEEAIDEELPARSAEGDVWALGDHRLFVGDCRESARVLKLLGNRAINLVFTSPPYAEQRAYDTSSPFRPIPPSEYRGWFEGVQKVIATQLADTGSYFLNIKPHVEGGQRHLYVADLVLAHVREWGWRFVDELAWVRQGWPGKYPDRFKNGWEPIYHFTLGKNITFDPKAVAQPGKEAYPTVDGPRNKRPVATGSSFYETDFAIPDGMVLPSNVVHVPQGATAATTGAKHSATFPVGLPHFFLKAFSRPGDLCYEPFLGSGTTLIACEQLGRLCVACEVSPKYADVGLARWEKLTGREAQRL